MAARACAALLNQHKPAVVVIELGGNDALRGLPMKNTEDNLRNMVQAAKEAGAKVLLVGMQVPPNYGSDYARDFAAAFGEVARQHQTALVPFLLREWPTGRTQRPCSSPTAFTPVQRRTRSCWRTCGRHWNPCCVRPRQDFGCRAALTRHHNPAGVSPPRGGFALARSFSSFFFFFASSR